MIKAKIFSFNAAFGTITTSPDKYENALNNFIQKNDLGTKEIISITQSESSGCMLTITFMYKD